MKKATSIYMLIGNRQVINTISDANLKLLADFFNVTPKAGVLKD